MAGCHGKASTLTVSLATSFVPGVEFTAIETATLTPGVPLDSAAVLQSVLTPVSRGDSFAHGRVVAEFSNSAKGASVVRVRLKKADGSTLTQRRVSFQNTTSAYALTLFLTRDCLNVTCGTGGSLNRSECLSGQCVDPQCDPSNVETRAMYCGDLTFCATAADCAPTQSCARQSCVTGVCNPTASWTGACGDTAWCNPDDGCVPLPDIADAGMDSGVLVDGGAGDAQPAPAPDATITAPMVAAVNASRLVASVPNQPHMTYAWTIEGGTITAGDGSHAITFSAGDPGTITLHCTVTNADNISATSMASVSVIAPPAMPVVSAPSAATAGATGLTASVSPEDGLTYAWTISGGTITSGADAANVVFTAGDPGSLMLSCQVTNAVGSSSGAATVMVVAAPVASIVTPTWTVALHSHLVAAVPSQMGDSFVWTIDGGTIDSGQGSNVISYSVGAAAGLVTVHVTVTNSATSDMVSGSAVVMVATSPTTATVTSSDDSGPGSLRAWASVLPAGSVISFDAALNGSTITLASPISLSNDLRITGPGLSQLAIDGGNRTQLFTTTAQLALTGLTLSHGIAAQGGAVSSTGSRLELTTCALYRNTSTGNGGAVYTTAAHNIFAADTFTSNSSGGGGGGAIYVDGAQALIGSTLFSSNTASTSSTGYGGAIAVAGGFTGFATIADSAFTGNQAASGGAIAAFAGGGANISDSTFAADVAPIGSAIFLGGGNGSSISFSTISGCTGSGALDVDGVAVNLKASILWGNSADFAGSGTVTSLGYNILQSVSGASVSTISSDQVGVDPLLSAVGLTRSWLPTISINASSPAVNAVPGSACMIANGNILTNDARGYPRPSAGNPNCDIGAFERQSMDP